MMIEGRSKLLQEADLEGEQSQGLRWFTLKLMNVENFIAFKVCEAGILYRVRRCGLL